MILRHINLTLQAHLEPQAQQHLAQPWRSQARLLCPQPRQRLQPYLAKTEATWLARLQRWLKLG